MLQYGIIDAIMTRTPSSKIHIISPPPWTLSPRCLRGRRPNLPVLHGSFTAKLQDKIARCGRIAEPQPWYRRGRHFAKRLWNFSRPAVTTDPYIADIRRHVFGNSDCTPQACNTVKDADGNVVRHGCGHLFPAEDFLQHWHACPACHRPDPLDPSTYVDLVLIPIRFRKSIPTSRSNTSTGGPNFTTTRQCGKKAPGSPQGLKP